MVTNLSSLRQSREQYNTLRSLYRDINDIDIYKMCYDKIPETLREDKRTRLVHISSDIALGFLLKNIEMPEVVSRLAQNGYNLNFEPYEYGTAIRATNGEHTFLLVTVFGNLCFTVPHDMDERTAINFIEMMYSK